MRRTFGRALIVAGLLTLTFVGSRYAMAAVRADRARQAWDEESARESVSAARLLGVTLDTESPAGTPDMTYLTSLSGEVVNDPDRVLVCTVDEFPPGEQAVVADVHLEEDVLPYVKNGDTLRIIVEEILSDETHDLGIDPGLQKDGVEKHLQELLAEHPVALSDGLSLVRREFPTAIGPVDLLCRDAAGATVAVEVKRRGEIDGVEQLTRYLELLNRDPLLAPVRGIFAAQEIKPQARVLATDRGIACVTVDYDALRGMDDPTARLF